MTVRRLLIVVAVLAAASCTTAPPPVNAPQGEAGHLIDPRIGWHGAKSDAIERRFEIAWRFFLSGDDTTARQRLEDIRSRDAEYAPAALAEAGIEIREAQLDAARRDVDRIAARYPNYTAAEVYEAEIDIAQNRIRSAYERYRSLIARPDTPPSASARYAELQTRVFDELYGAATSARPEDAIALLRESLEVNPNATAARILLVRDLIALKRFDEAKRELDPLPSGSAADQPDVQESLAEIDVGQGQYEDAIVRYERLARNDSNGKYARRLEQVKELFAAANMPPQFLRAMDAESITKADLAVLLYWKVASVRFAQNVPAPPIAIDISESPGRDEIIRTIALGIYTIDPVTRRVNPDAIVTGASLARIVARVLTFRGAPCARGVASDSILAACEISIATDDLPVSGRTAASVLDQVDQAISR